MKPRRSDKEVMKLLLGESKFNQARLHLSSGMASIEQAQLQRTTPSSVEIRRMEFELVERVLAIFNVDPTKGD